MADAKIPADRFTGHRGQRAIRYAGRQVSCAGRSLSAESGETGSRFARLLFRRPSAQDGPRASVKSPLRAWKVKGLILDMLSSEGCTCARTVELRERYNGALQIIERGNRRLRH